MAGRAKSLVIAGVGALAVITLAASGSSTPSSSSKGSSTASTSSPATAASNTPTTVPVRHVIGTAVTLGAGQFSGGKDVAVGLYDVTAGPGQSGNFVVQGTDSYDEILGGSDGVPKVRAKIADGDSIQISSLTSVIFTPVTTPLVTTHSQVILYAGTWTVGEDLGSGRYVATPGAGQSGNFIIEAEGVDEILGGSDGVPNVTFNVKDGDVITVGSLSQVTLSPA